MKLNKHIQNTFIPRRHNQYKPHAIRHYGLLVVAALVVTMQGLFNYQISGDFKVLGYATNITSGGLLSGTNQQRANNGLPALSLHGNLSTAAQNKAQHMIDNDYWAHTSPDGVTPWYWIDITGYGYQKAGENLAYGFTTSTATIQGWMDSPGHRANILDSSFSEVGFGFANGSNFQGGQYTVVVAMYAQPNSAPPPSPPAPEPVVQSQESTPQASQPIVDEPVVEEPEEEEVAEAEEDIEEDQEVQLSQRFLARTDDGIEVTFGSIDSSTDVKGSTVSNLQALIQGKAHWSYYVTISALLAVSGVYLMRHLTAVYQLVRHGEHYVLGHPLLEASIVYLAVWLALAGTFGAVL